MTPHGAFPVDLIPRTLRSAKIFKLGEAAQRRWRRLDGYNE
jgi:hypothetical protein